VNHYSTTDWCTCQTAVKKHQECWKIDVRENEPKDVSSPSAQEDILKMQELGKEMAQWIPRHLMNLRDFYDVD
jgi:hypothetical protein